MADARGAAAGALTDGRTVSMVQEILSTIPGGCTWLVPVPDGDGVVVDFLVAAAAEGGRDILDRGADRVNSRVSELYPSIVDGPLWQLYHAVMATGTPGRLREFRYEEKRPGFVTDAVFDITARPLFGGLLVWWQRLDEDRRRLDHTERLGRLGWAEYDLATGVADWSPGMYRLFDRDPDQGPLSRAEQTTRILPDDRGLVETAWQTLDSGAVSDVTVRFRVGGSVRHLRILSDVARDADGKPLKIYAVVQDVTGRQNSRSQIERLTDRLRTREMTAIAEHRLAAQLQNMIQPVPAEPFMLAGLEVSVRYLPAESAVRVGGDWYHAQTLPDGFVALAIGDVAGHGLAAAGGMANLRYALVAWLSIGIREPGVLMSHLNRLSVQLKTTGSAILALYDPQSKIMRWARAGHAPPLLARAGTTVTLDRPPGMLLGVDAEAAYPVQSVELRPDDLLLFYTDGLVERRTRAVDELLGTVMDVLSDASTGPGRQTLARLRGHLHYSSPFDDTCTVAVRALA